MQKPNVQLEPHLRFHGIDSSKRLTKNFRESLKRSWIHPYIRLRRFIHDYSLPVIVTIVFLLLVTFAAFLRASQQSSLADLLASVTDGGQDYGTLLSKDKSDELKKNEDNADITQPDADLPASAGTTFAVSPSSGGGTASSPAVVQNPVGGGGNTPSPVFSASIAYFRQDGAALECTTPKPKLQTCSKRYTFGAGIRSQNGPGSVSYGWRSNLQSLTENSNISAGSVDAVIPLQKSVALACTDASSFSLQIALSSPSSVQSAVINTNHNCNEI